jgi:hypothetical protein
MLVNEMKLKSMKELSAILDDDSTMVATLGEADAERFGDV